MRFLSILMLSSLVVLGSCLGDPGDTLAERLEKDVAIIDNYLQVNAVDAIKDISGVRYSIQTLGTGYTPRFTDQVTFDYTGTFIDGTVFQSSTLTDATISNLIPGFQIGLTQIPVGSIAKLYIPSGYAYGEAGQSGIPANSILIFEIKLKKIKVTATERNQLGADTVAIDDYLLDAEIADVVKDTTGLRYVIETEGTGEIPSWFNRVKINYEGYLLTNGAKGAKFYAGSSEPNSTTDSRIVNFIRGFQFGLMKLPKGSTAWFYVPSGMGFGSQVIPGGLVEVPANSNLIYKVELIDVFDPNP